MPKSGGGDIEHKLSNVSGDGEENKVRRRKKKHREISMSDIMPVCKEDSEIIDPETLYYGGEDSFSQNPTSPLQDYSEMSNSPD